MADPAPVVAVAPSLDPTYLRVDPAGGAFLAQEHVELLQRVERKLDEFILAMKSGALGKWTK